MKKIYFNQLFLFGLTIRLIFIFYVQAQPVTEWYVPFLDVSITQFDIDPWKQWLEQGGAKEAFPYGYAMWLIFLPLISFAKFMDAPLLFGYSCTLLVADIFLLVVLNKLLPKREFLLLSVYWLSPIVLLASYGLGLNDLIPVLFLVLSLFFVRHKMMLYAGLMVIVSVSAKLSMIIAVPFFLIYLYHNRSMRQLLPDFLKGVLIATLLFIFPFILSPSGLFMLFNNPIVNNIYHLSFSVGNNISVYIVPLVYFFMLYNAWRVHRLDFELFQSILGISFLLVVLLTPSSFGWFVWVLPLLVFYQAKSGKIAVILVMLFSVLYVVDVLLSVSGLPIIYDFLNQSVFELPLESQYHISSLWHTFMIAIGFVLIVKIWREMISRNDYFRLSRKSLVIGVSGSFGSGKSTFSGAMKGLFGDHSVTVLEGDNYHRWDRQKPIWQVMTRLNPMANNLEEFASDLVALTDGKSIYSKNNVNAKHKAKIATIKSKPIIVSNGLHALYLPILRERYDLSVYLDIDENLRNYFMVNDDVKTLRNVLVDFEKCKADFLRFIKPQENYADLVFSLRPVNPKNLENMANRQSLRLKLAVRSRRLNEDSLIRILIGICGLHVDMAVTNNASEIEFTIEGEASALDIELAAKLICPRIFEFLDINPKWQDGVLGLIQLITLSNIDYTFTRRIV